MPLGLLAAGGCMTAGAASAVDALDASYVATTLTSGRVRNMEHTQASKSFYHDGAWWAVLPNGNNWYVHRFDGPLPAPGALGGWTKASPQLSANQQSADIAWDAANARLYVLNYGPDSSKPYLYRLSYNAATRSFALQASILMAGATGAKLKDAHWGKNVEMALVLDQQGRPLLAGIGPSALGGTVGLHVVYPLTSDLSTWTEVLVDGGTAGTGGTSSGNSKADFVVFSLGGVPQVGLAYSADAAVDSWKFAYHAVKADPSTYGGGWKLDTITNRVTIDNHVAALFDGTSVFVVMKDSKDAIWMAKGLPGAWGAPVKVHNGQTDKPARDASRPTLVLDQDNREILVFYQQHVTNPYGSIYFKKTSTASLSFNAASTGTRIMTTGSSAEDMIDPQPPVHPVGAATGGKLFMFAKGEDVPKVWYNDIDLAAPTSITVAGVMRTAP